MSDPNLWKNPFIAGNSVGRTGAFVGRHDLLTPIRQAIAQASCSALVIYGQRRIGKTSLLEHAGAALQHEGSPLCHTVYFDLQDRARMPLVELVHDLARAIARVLGRPLPASERLTEIDFREKWLSACLDSLPNASRLVLLFDEFDVLADPKDDHAARTLYPYLRQLLSDNPRLFFVYAIGRSIGDLDTLTSQLFKGVDHYKVSLLSERETLRIVRLSEDNGTMRWSEGAGRAVYRLTRGHPYLTQQVCSVVWLMRHSDDSLPEIIATEEDVEAAIDKTLEISEGNLHWLWGGLTPACKVVAAALAHHPRTSVTLDDLETILGEHGIRMHLREFQSAPALLQDWDLLEPDGEGVYRFRVELLRRWIKLRMPLAATKAELDKVVPEADSYFNVAQALYRDGSLQKATEMLRDARRINPHHIGASELLSDLLVKSGEYQEAREILDQIYKIERHRVRGRLLETTILCASNERDERRRLDLLESARRLDSSNESVQREFIELARKIGEELRQNGDLAAAAELFRRAGRHTLEQEVRDESVRRERDVVHGEIESLRRAGNLQAALDCARHAAERYQGFADWPALVNRLEQEVRVYALYETGREHLHNGSRHEAQEAFLQIAQTNLEYRDTVRYLYWAVRGRDPVRLGLFRWTSAWAGAFGALAVVAILRPSGSDTSLLRRIGESMAAAPIPTGHEVMPSDQMAPGTCRERAQPIGGVPIEPKDGDTHEDPLHPIEKTKASGEGKKRKKLDCEVVRRAAKDFDDERAWLSLLRVLDDSDTRKCWSREPWATERRKLRVHAYKETKQFEMCVDEGTGIRDHAVERSVSLCARRLESERDSDRLLTEVET